MYKKFVSLTFIILATLSLSACQGFGISIGPTNMVRGSGNVITETRSVSGFDSVSVSNSGEATITVGDNESLLITAEDNILPLITSEVIGGKLHIGTKPGSSYSSTRSIRYVITVKSLKGVETSGSVDISVTNSAKADSFNASTSGSGQIKLADVQSSSVSLHTSGSGRIEIAGKTNRLEAATSGSGEVLAGSLSTDTATVSTSGSGNITLWAKESLTAHTSGSGNVRYYGQPNVSRSESGSGRVTSLGNK
jgi:hypothetical protein